MPRVEVNKIAPEIELMDFAGKAFSLEDYQDEKWVLLVLNRGFT